MTLMLTVKATTENKPISDRAHAAPPFSRTAHPRPLTLLLLLGYVTFRHRKDLHPSYDVRANPDLDRLYHIMQPPDSF